MVEHAVEKTSSIEISDLWKYLSAIGISCAISFGGHWMSENNKYVTDSDVEKIISSKQEILQNEMKHYEAALAELKRVVENNNTIMQGVREELATMRQEIKNYLSK